MVLARSNSPCHSQVGSNLRDDPSTKYIRNVYNVTRPPSMHMICLRSTNIGQSCTPEVGASAIALWSLVVLQLIQTVHFGHSIVQLVRRAWVNSIKYAREDPSANHGSVSSISQCGFPNAGCNLWIYSDYNQYIMGRSSAELLWCHKSLHVQRNNHRNSLFHGHIPSSTTLKE